MLNIAVLTDVHANLPAFEAILADAGKYGCERLYHAGDLIAIGPYPAEVVDLARAINLISIQGNHETWVVNGLPLDPIPGMSDEELQHQHWTHSRLDKSRRDYIRAMPVELNEVLEGVHLYLVHFALDYRSNSYKNVDFRSTDAQIMSLFGSVNADLVCFGHLHNRRINQPFNGRFFLNPGSVGCNHSSIAPYAVVSINHGAFSVEHREVPYKRAQLLAQYDRLEIPAKDTIRKLFFA